MDFTIFEARPGLAVLMLPDAPKFTVLAASNDYIDGLALRREAFVGRGFFESFPENPLDPNFTGEQNVKTSYEHVLRCKVPHQLPLQRYDIRNADGTFSEKYWKALNVPVLNNGGDVTHIIHTVEDVSDLVKADQRLESTKGIEKAYNFFMNAPVIIGFVRGEDYIIELANEGLLEVWGRDDEVIGKPLVEAIPELEKQGFKELLDGVRTTGEPFYAYEYPITLNRHGKEETLYFYFVYKPFYENGTDKIASGVISVGHDVTTQVLAAKKGSGK